MVGVLVLLALALITASFRESESGPLHDAQGAASTALRPFQVAVERVARPFRDAYGWTSRPLRRQGRRRAAAAARTRFCASRSIQNESALQQNVQLRALLDYVNGPEFPGGYRYVATEVVSTAPRAFQQEIVVAVGANDGVVLNAPVVTNDGLVGQVTRVFSRTARVTLITDEQSFVSAEDLRSGATGDRPARRRRETRSSSRASRRRSPSSAATRSSPPAGAPTASPRSTRVGSRSAR